MKNPTPLFPGFHLQTLRRKPRSARQKLLEQKVKIRQKSFSELAESLSHIVPVHHLKQNLSGMMSRQRLFSKSNTFWAFFSQILDADGGCQEVVRKLQAVAVLHSKSITPSSSTAAYCQARKKLDITELENILGELSKRPLTKPTTRLQGRRVIVADGTGISMPDTKENQSIWPQSAMQKPGCGFPQARICACFDLATGMLNSYKIGNKKSHELTLLRQQWNSFSEGDIFLGDKMFCSYYDMANLLKQGIDSVVSLRRKPVPASQADHVFDQNDLLIHWDKPKRSHSTNYSVEQGELLPDQLPVRQIKVVVDQPGFRVSTFYIVTTLLDPEQYPAGEIIDLYRQRWDVELNFRHIKTTMNMDVLRCKSPDMVHKEIVMYFIVYNCIRQLILESVKHRVASVRRVSFKGSLQSLRQWEPRLSQARLTSENRRLLLNELYRLIAQKTVIERPDRAEPRAVKRRPKNYQRMTKPRQQMLETPHRGKRPAKAA